MTTWHGGVSHSPGGTSRNLVTLPRIAHKVNLRIVCFWNFPCNIFLDHRRLGNRNHGKQSRDKRGLSYSPLQLLVTLIISK